MFGSKDLPARTVASRLPPPKGNLQTPARLAETAIPYIPRPAIVREILNRLNEISFNATLLKTNP